MLHSIMNHVINSIEGVKWPGLKKLQGMEATLPEKKNHRQQEKKEGSLKKNKIK